MRNILILLAVAVCMYACSSRTPENGMSAGRSIHIDEQPGQCPNLTKDNNGNAVLSWVRIVNDSTTAFCYAVSKDGKTFSGPIIIPNTADLKPHGENLPKVIFKPSGEIIALWGAANLNPKNKYSGLVYYTQSFDNGKNWNTPKPLVTDTASYDQRYYDVALLPNGEAAIIWLDNRKTIKQEGSGLYYATTNGKNGFSDGRLISEQCCQCCRTDLFIDKKGNIHALYRGIIQDSIRDMVHIVSADGGKTFSTPQRISNDNWVVKGCPHTGPAMTENEAGIHFSWFTGGRKRGAFYTMSGDNGKTFGMHDSVSSAGSHPQIASLTNGEVLIVWDETAFAGDNSYKRIGLQKRDAAGKSNGKIYITGADNFATYPVIAPLDERSAFVAFTRELDGKSYVDYQRVMVK